MSRNVWIQWKIVVTFIKYFLQKIAYQQDGLHIYVAGHVQFYNENDRKIKKKINGLSCAYRLEEPTSLSDDCYFCLTPQNSSFSKVPCIYNN